MLWGTALAANLSERTAPASYTLPITQVIHTGDEVIEKHYATTMDDSTIWDFEPDEDGWTHFGNGVQEAWWHTDYDHAWSGRSWWSGSDAVGGYLNDSYMTLDTPSIDLTTATAPLTLTFKLKYGYEAPGGEPTGYDSWDAGNLRISTDGGSSWTVLSGIPAYEGLSSYAFGYQFGEGTGVPGWNSISGGGPVHAWVDASFDLSAYAGMSDVQLRWCSCADPAYDFNDDTDLIGLLIDDVVLQDPTRTVFMSIDGDVASVPGEPVSGYLTGSDYWVYTDTQSHSATHSFNCDDINNINPYCASPSVTLGSNVSIYLSLWTWCDMPDSDGNDDGFLEDYFHVHISTNGGATWEDLCYDYARQGFNYDTLGAVTWGLMDNNAIFNGTLELTDYAGQTIRVAVSVTTDENSDGGDGTGLFIDDVRIDEYDAPGDDCGISRIWMDSPRSENLVRNVGVELSNYGLNEQFNVPCWYKVEKDAIEVQAPIVLSPFTDVGPQSKVRYYGTNSPFEPRAGEGVYTFTAWTSLPGDALTENDTLTYDFYVYEDGLGLFIYDDDISTAWTLDAADWAFIRVDQDLGFPFNAKWFTCLLYGMFPGDPLNIEIYDAGIDDDHLGSLIAEFDGSVNVTYPTYDHFFIGDIPELQGRTTDFWIGVQGPCGIVGLSGEPWWISHSYYGYDDAVREFVIEDWGGDLSFVVEGCWGGPCFVYCEVELTISYSAGDIALDWNDCEGADTYTVYRSTDPYFTPDVGNLLVAGLAASEYVDVGVAGSSYFYIVVAVQN